MQVLPLQPPRLPSLVAELGQPRVRKQHLQMFSMPPPADDDQPHGRSPQAELHANQHSGTAGLTEPDCSISLGHCGHRWQGAAQAGDHDCGHFPVLHPVPDVYDQPVCQEGDPGPGGSRH